MLGSWALKMAADNAGLHFLGLEIRRPVVDLCLRRKENSKLKNIHFLAVNANVDLDDILSSLRDREQPIEVHYRGIYFSLSREPRLSLLSLRFVRSLFSFRIRISNRGIRNEGL